MSGADRYYVGVLSIKNRVSVTRFGSLPKYVVLVSRDLLRYACEMSEEVEDDIMVQLVIAAGPFSSVEESRRFCKELLSKRKSGKSIFSSARSLVSKWWPVKISDLR